MGGYQNYGPFLGTLNIRCRTIIGTQKGTIILTTSHIYVGFRVYRIKGGQGDYIALRGVCARSKDARTGC